MKKICLILLFILSLNADVKDIYPDIHILNSNIKIFDIRTESEWKDTGVIKNSILLTFFDEKGMYDAKGFLTELNKNIKPNEEFAIVCRSGSRTKSVSSFLGQLGYNVINFQGGILYIKNLDYKLTKVK
ncbi:MAG: rhodanese-like domain-containing protein [Campylobacterales bacterium]|nr:rhodanese-like domain-containing protein [Campylobacterales bacterium]